MATTEIPTVKGRRYGREKVDIKNNLSFDLPERDPGRIPSLQRQLTKPQTTDKKSESPTRSIRPTSEQGLGYPSKGPVPTRISTQPTKEEKVPNLSELLG